MTADRALDIVAVYLLVASLSVVVGKPARHAVGYAALWPLVLAWAAVDSIAWHVWRYPAWKRRRDRRERRAR